MKNLSLFIMLFFLLINCAGNLPPPVYGRSFYSESIKDGEKILKIMNWYLIRIDTLKENNRNIYLFFYKNK